jgi:hypothetical protein
VASVLRSRGSVPVRKLASMVGKLVLLEVAFGPAILVGTRIVSIQVSEVSEPFGREGVFVVLSDNLRVTLMRITVSLDLWNGHPMRTPASEIALTSVLAFEDAAGTARKIPNRRLDHGVVVWIKRPFEGFPIHSSVVTSRGVAVVDVQ